MPDEPPIRAVVFDLDNTLMLSEKCKFDTMREVVGRYDGGLEVLETVPNDSRTAPPGVSVTRHTIFEGVARGLHARGVRGGQEEESAEAFGKRLCDEFSALLDERLPQALEVAGAGIMLAQLNAAGLPCYVNTATPQEPAERVVTQRDWMRHFRAVLGAPGTKEENLAAAAAAEGLTSQDIVHVGDGNNDCVAAHTFGCRFIGVVLDGGSGSFTAPVLHTVQDMHGARDKLFELAGVAPPAVEGS